MDFDFAAYLRRLDPTYIYRVGRLSGGVVNVTVRASKDRLLAVDVADADADTATAAIAAAASQTSLRASDSTKTILRDENTETVTELDYRRGCFPEHRSLILKYAPPYIAGVGESAPMSQGRQEIEAASLALFLSASSPDGSSALSPTPSRGVLRHVAEKSGVMIPHLLHHDPAEHVLILSDLGALPDLSKIFIELGGFTPDVAGAASWQPPPYAPRLGHALEPRETVTYRTIGEKLGTFFARLHCLSSVQSIVGTRRDQAYHGEGAGEGEKPRAEFPSLPEMKSAIHDHVIKPIRSQLDKFPFLLDAAEAENLFAAVEADFLRPTPPEERRLVLGDCWTGAVLVDMRHETCDDESNVGVGVIDWEFASIDGRGVNGDVSQFLAHLELLRVAAHTHPPGRASGHLSAVNAIIEGFISRYKLAQISGSFVGDDDEKNDVDNRVMRSAYLSHGAEMINCAFWKTWVCRDPACPSCTKTTNTTQNPSSPDPRDNADPPPPQCTVITNLVRRGISFLRCAVAPDPRGGTTMLRQTVAGGGDDDDELLVPGPDAEMTQTMGLYDLFNET
ncbi:hypothetical protein Z517_00679 [Fonsecaea pedrosoi CBS 271.37]|uniref:Aminoglycoside phosphotransferase domain-containing protein n=1 Tax=Fonsecaea pedrosoi CBS 271.37 TaxID=1442368 RepID=A0A0D2HLB2_9EURO|nr:uncharacterized protein Z517_00679 [Fonsecaea pedrosoi CBS 271.37]KIW85289.1 hypothetical protein Z517_00679 [Fonsecaea pedrosoi CBS 271.37]